MTDFRDRWVVCLGELYFGGLGHAYINQACVGWVLTKIRDHAQEFTSLDSARQTARAIGGTVYKV